uniref:proprotein convertase subtilisin/kexin type 5-like n=1 Tax=Panthera onca TaxID=9690 RepID=UPI0029539585|nr:proprotein convertase subtilisin/kexin type 5-like [Panthera onca]
MGYQDSGLAVHGQTLIIDLTPKQAIPKCLHGDLVLNESQKGQEEASILVILGASPARRSSSLLANNEKVSFQHHCHKMCPERTYGEGSECKPCDTNCSNCDQHECYSCEEGFFLLGGTCVRNCGPGFYGDPETGECEPCHRACETCTGFGHQQCRTCREGLQLRQGTCVGPAQTPVEGEFWNAPGAPWPSLTVSPARTPPTECHKSCRACSSPGTCTTCREGLGVASHGRCVPHKECAPIEYWDEALGCKPCHAKCFRCTGPAEDQCRTCPRDSLLLNTTCVQDCPEGHYADEDSHQCAPCHSSCRTCEGRRSTQCLSCQPSSFQLEKECLPQCREGYYAEEATGRCERCSKTCKACRGPRPTDCLSCDTFFFLLRSKGECHRTCPEHYYADQNTRTCERCHPTCNKCRGSLEPRTT